MTAAVPLVERLAEVLAWHLPGGAGGGVAAKEAEERGDIGKDGGCEAWTWLRIRADRIGGAE